MEQALACDVFLAWRFQRQAHRESVKLMPMIALVPLLLCVMATSR
jgi:hypothetical protein